jgi:hypothetical protein
MKGSWPGATAVYLWGQKKDKSYALTNLKVVNYLNNLFMVSQTTPSNANGPAPWKCDIFGSQIKCSVEFLTLSGTLAVKTWAITTPKCIPHRITSKSAPITFISHPAHYIFRVLLHRKHCEGVLKYQWLALSLASHWHSPIASTSAFHD